MILFMTPYETPAIEENMQKLSKWDFEMKEKPILIRSTNFHISWSS